MAQDEDLDVAVVTVVTDRDHSQQTAQDQVEDREEHRRMLLNRPPHGDWCFRPLQPSNSGTTCGMHFIDERES